LNLKSEKKFSTDTTLTRGRGSREEADVRRTGRQGLGPEAWSWRAGPAGPVTWSGWGGRARRPATMRPMWHRQSVAPAACAAPPASEGVRRSGGRLPARWCGASSRARAAVRCRCGASSRAVRDCEVPRLTDRRPAARVASRWVRPDHSVCCWAFVLGLKIT
jgi:hypothetical protein